MKLHDKQQFEVSGVSWEFSKGELPQGILNAKSSNGKTICSIRPADWSKPIWAENNAVLMTRSGQGNQWSESGPQSIRDAVKKGTQRVQSYEQNQQIAKMEHALQNGKQGISASNDTNRSKPLKGRAAIKAMQAATELYQDGAHHTAQRNNQNKDRGME